MIDEETVLENYCEKKGIDYESISEKDWFAMTKNIERDISTYMDEIVANGTFDDECWFQLKTRGYIKPKFNEE